MIEPRLPQRNWLRRGPKTETCSVVVYDADRLSMRVDRAWWGSNVVARERQEADDCFGISDGYDPLSPSIPRMKPRFWAHSAQFPYKALILSGPRRQPGLNRRVKWISARGGSI
jgi:hypothetical protein